MKRGKFIRHGSNGSIVVTQGITIAGNDYGQREVIVSPTCIVTLSADESDVIGNGPDHVRAAAAIANVATLDDLLPGDTILYSGNPASRLHAVRP